jgi:membrane protein YdbS with pleckstrin-like domain
MGAMSAVDSPVRDPAWPLDRTAVGLWTAHGLLRSLGAAPLAVAAVLAVPAGAPGPLPALRWLVPLLVALYAAVQIGVEPWIRFRVHRWEVTDDAVYTLTGWLNRTWTLVPVARIQTVDVTRGPLQLLFGLASVAVLTASSHGTVHIPHLASDVARRVADDLARRAEAVRDEAT